MSAEKIRQLIKEKFMAQKLDPCNNSYVDPNHGMEAENPLRTIERLLGVIEDLFKENVFLQAQYDYSMGNFINICEAQHNINAELGVAFSRLVSQNAQNGFLGGDGFLPSAGLLAQARNGDHAIGNRTLSGVRVASIVPYASHRNCSR